MQENVSLSGWTTFGVGGPARYFMTAASEDGVAAGLEFAADRGLPVFVLGGGSNLLVSDSGFPGLALHIGMKGIEWADAGGRLHVRAAAGENWDDVVAASVSRGGAGLECLSGIPGLAGATPIQNVGAYGQETADTFVRLRAFDRAAGAVVELQKKDCALRYRTSIFNTTERNRYVVLDVTFALEKDAPPSVRYADLVRRFEKASSPPSLLDVRRAVLEIRAGKGMVIAKDDSESRSAGSFFKNPLVESEELSRIQAGSTEPVPIYPGESGRVKLSAAWLIERAGFPRGFASGPAAVSRKHTLALVNRGGARAADIVRLGRRIREGVFDRFGLRLLPEPVFLGFDEEF